MLYVYTGLSHPRYLGGTNSMPEQRRILGVLIPPFHFQLNDRVLQSKDFKINFPVHSEPVKYPNSFADPKQLSRQPHQQPFTTCKNPSLLVNNEYTDQFLEDLLRLVHLEHISAYFNIML